MLPLHHRNIHHCQQYSSWIVSLYRFRRGKKKKRKQKKKKRKIEIKGGGKNIFQKGVKKIVFLPILFPFHDLVVKWSVSLRSTAERFVVDNNELRILLTSIPLFQLWEFEFSREAGCWTAVEFDSISVDFSNSPRREFFKYSFRVAPIREVEPKYLTRDSCVCKLKNVEIINSRNEIG